MRNTSIQSKLKKFSFSIQKKICAIFLTGETTLFSERRWGVIWQNKFLLMWHWERISNSCPKCDSYISSSSVTSFTPPSPHPCHSNRPEINIPSTLIFFFHPERDVGLQWRKWVLAPTPSKRCFRFQTDDLVCAIHHPVKDFVFSGLPLNSVTRGKKQPIICADEDESLNKYGDCFAQVRIFNQ